MSWLFDHSTLIFTRKLGYDFGLEQMYDIKNLNKWRKLKFKIESWFQEVAASSQPLDLS